MTGLEYKEYIAQKSVTSSRENLEEVNLWNFFLWPQYSKGIVMTLE
jgi:hypothetical protein